MEAQQRQGGMLMVSDGAGPLLAEHKCPHTILAGITMGMGIPRVSHWISTARSLPAHSLSGVLKSWVVLATCN